MIPFIALIVDAYRELNSRKLFWVVLALSGLFVVVYASIGFDENGMFMFFGLKHIESDLIYDGSPMARLLYRGIFATFVVPIWLAWIATILALISTAPIFPEFLSGGAIDLVLSKPLTRLWLFFSKYLASLLFVVVQVTVFCGGVFIAMGWRLGDWEWKVFLAVPLLVLFYSYLYSFCVIIGVWTRSTLAALLLTMLMWVGIYTVSATEAVVLLFRSQFQVQVDRIDRQLERDQAGGNIDLLHSEREEIQSTIDKFDYWLKVVYITRWPLPKTSETIDLLGRTLSREGDINLMDLMQGNVAVGADGRPIKKPTRDEDERAEQLMAEEFERRSPWFIIGTSLLFELLMLSGAAWIFCRRDF